MLHFPRPPEAVRAALEMVHVGIHAGPVVFQDADYYGRTVNLAARVAAHAGPQQVLVTDAVKELTSDDIASFRSLGTVSLKGVPEPVSLHEARRT